LFRYGKSVARKACHAFSSTAQVGLIQALDAAGKTMDDQALAEIEARFSATTKGPWESFVEGRDHLSGDSFIRTGGMDNDSPDLYLSGGTLQDQDFVAHA
jgi:hypothetical protein